MALTKRQLLMVKAESSYGTAPSPAATGTNALLVLDPSLTPIDGTLIERPLVDSAFGRTRSRLVTARKMGLSFGIDAIWSGTAGTAPGHGLLLRACGFTETIVATTSVTYAPTSVITDSVEMYHNWDGNKHQGLGGRGSFEMAFTSGEVPKFNYTMSGIYVAPTDVVLPSPTYTAQGVPLAVDSTNTASVTVAGLSACMSEFSLNVNNTIEFFDNAGCTRQVRITDRMVEGSITIERPDALSTKDFYALHLAGTSSAVTFTHGTVAGSRVVVTLPTVNFGPPAAVDIKGVAGLQLPFVALHTPGSSDELSIAFT